MFSTLSAGGGWLRRRAENLIALMLGVMFVAFLVQIVSRYVFDFPIGWTSELTVIMWLWIILFGAAFVVRESEEIRFDLIYGAMGPGARRVTATITGIFVIALYSFSLPAILDYVLFMKVQRTAYLHIRFDVLYSIYVVFAVAVICRYLYIVWNAATGRGPAAFDPTKASSGM